MAVSLAALVLALSAPGASALTIGQLASTPEINCAGSVNADFVQPTVTSGQAYVFPTTNGISSWTVTSWSTKATADAGQKMSLKVFRKVNETPAYLAVSHEGPHDLLPGLNQFPAHIVVRAGDLLGLHFKGPQGACTFDAAGEKYDSHGGDLQDGVSGDFVTNTVLQWRLNISAEITPTSEFTIDKVKAKPNGTGVLSVTLPNPGDLSVSGKGVKGSAASAAQQVAAGPAKVVIRAKGKKKRKLADTGKVTVKPKISFTPTGGSANAQTRKVKLRRK